MHTYDFHIGDYARDTVHLTLLEHGVYRLLLDRAYADEAPLTSDSSKLMRKLGAKTAAEQKAVETILAEFFIKTEEGYTHKRVIEELGEARSRSLKSKYSQVIRWWRHNKWPNEPTLETYIENPEAYHDPITGHIRQPNERNTTVDNRNSYQPPTANRQPPTATKDLTPLIPQGGDDRALDLASGIETSASAAETPPPPHTKSEATASRKKKKGGAARLTEAQFPSDLPEPYIAPLTAWFGYKRQVGKGYVVDGWAALVARERQFTPEQVTASVQTSMANSYDGLFTADLIAKTARNGSAQKKERPSAAPARPVSQEPEWDWRALCARKWGNAPAPDVRWQDLPNSVRFELRQLHESTQP